MLCDCIIVCGTQYVKTFFHAYIFKYYISEYQNLSVNRLRKLNGLILVRSAFENCIEYGGKTAYQQQGVAYFPMMSAIALAVFAPCASGYALTVLATNFLSRRMDRSG